MYDFIYLFKNDFFKHTVGQVHEYLLPVRLNFSMLTPNICGSSVWDSLLVTIQVSRIFKWLLDFWKICATVPLGVRIRTEWKR